MSKQECFHHRTVTFFDCHLITTIKLGEFIEWYQAFANSILSRIGVKQFSWFLSHGDFKSRDIYRQI